MDVEDILVLHSIKVMLQRLTSPSTLQSGRLLGLGKDLDSVVGSLPRIQAVLGDIGDKISSNVEASWLRKLEYVSCDADAMLDELSYEILRRKVGIRKSFFSLYTRFDFLLRMRRKIGEIGMQFKEICEVQRAYLISSVGDNRLRRIDHPTLSLPETYVGREKDASVMVGKLLRPTDEVFSVFPIVGMAALGKTALAQMIYNDLRIVSHYDLRIWVYAGENMEITWLFQAILEHLQTDRVTWHGRDAIVQRIRQLLEWRRYLLVIDDVWDEKYTFWYDLLRTMRGINSERGSAIVLTTRKQIVASMVATHSPHVLGKLSDEDCWRIIMKRAGLIGHPEMPPATETIVREIAKKCAGMPLFAVVYGGLLRFKYTAKELKAVLGGSLHDLDLLLGIIELSFRNLPSPSLKKCFAYCSVFPNGVVIDVEDLIQLWMAQGYLAANNSLVLENIGYKHLDLLLQNSLFQEVERDKYDNITHCGMHESMHLLAKYLSRFETTHLADSSTTDLQHARHLVMSSPDERIHQIGEGRVRALFSKSWIPDLGRAFKRLHVLNLCEANLEELPPSIGRLIHLRYLNLACTNIHSMPKSVCKLYNLQTLRLQQCPYLQRLPKGIVNLISLRHLYLQNYGDGKFEMPAGIGKLSSLQTLLFFNVGVEKGHQIEELGCLKNLRGKLEIRNLEKVREETVAKKADISGKQNLYELKFQWNTNRDVDNGNEDESVLEGLQPHTNLKGLTVENFMGRKFPSWIKRLNNLVEINIVNCRRCRTIPTLGHLPVLHNLSLVGMETLTTIGTSFYAADDSFLFSSSGKSDEVSNIFFPALRSLSIKDMPCLVEWMDVQEMPHSSCRTGAFPHLEVLIIKNCKSLTTIPHHFRTLKELDLEDVDRRVTMVLSDITEFNRSHILSEDGEK